MFGIDGEVCPHCSDGLRIIASIEDPVVINQILSRMETRQKSSDPPQVDLFEYCAKQCWIITGIEPPRCKSGYCWQGVDHDGFDENYGGMSAQTRSLLSMQWKNIFCRPRPRSFT